MKAIHNCLLYDTDKCEIIASTENEPCSESKVQKETLYVTKRRRFFLITEKTYPWETRKEKSKEFFCPMSGVQALDWCWANNLDLNEVLRHALRTDALPWCQSKGIPVDQIMMHFDISEA